MSVTCKVPELRFSEFSGEWEKKKLGEIFEEVKDKVGQENIETYSITAGKGFVSQKKKFGKDISGQQNKNYIILDRNEFSYNKGNSKSYKYGCIYPNYCGTKIAVPNVFISFKLIDKDMSVHYFAKYFEHHYLDRGLRRIISSSARMDGLLNINKKYFFDLIISLPSKQEQEKIASFLSSVDSKIEQLSKKKTLLEQYKKGVMQKIFSQELRFKDDNGSEFPEWVERKLGEISKITTGNSNREDSSLDGEYTFFDRSEDIRTSSRFLFDGEAVIVAGEGQQFIPKYFVGKFDLHQRTYAIMQFNDAVGKFIYYLIYKNQNYFLSQAVGSTVKSLRLPMFQIMKTKLPSLKEQTKIANFLSSLDKKIELTDKELETTKAFKKGLLQKMFV